MINQTHRAENAFVQLPVGVKWLLVLVLALTANLFVLSLSIDVFSMSPSFYAQEFEKLGTAEMTGLTPLELEGVSDMIIRYLKGQAPEFQHAVERAGRTVPLFNEREQSHMVDVLDLFLLNGRIRTITISAFALAAFVALQIARDKKILAKGFMGAGFLGIAFAALLLMLIAVDFTRYFTLFHELFFDNDLWLLDPRTDLLIVILQEQFFVDIAIRIFGLYVALSGVLAMLGGLGAYRLRKRTAQ